MFYRDELIANSINRKRRKNHRIKTKGHAIPKDSQQIRSLSCLESLLGTYQGTSVSYCCCICCCEAMLLSENFSLDGGLFVVLSSASRCWSLASFISFKTRLRWSLASFKAAVLSMLWVQMQYRWQARTALSECGTIKRDWAQKRNVNRIQKIKLGVIRRCLLIFLATCCTIFKLQRVSRAAG